MKRVMTDEIIPGDVLAATVKVSSENDATLYRLRIDVGTTLDQKHIKRLEKTGVNYVFVHDPDTEDLDKYIYDEEIDEIQEEIVRDLETVFSQVQEGHPDKWSIKKLQLQVQHLIEALQNSEVMIAFTTLKSYDDYTAKHSIDVAKLSIHMVIAYESWFQEKLLEDSGATPDYVTKFMLEDLGLGGLLHDVGKWKIPKDVLHKPGKLDSHEWEAIKRHPDLGREFLNDLELNLRAPVKVPALTHHEQYGGGGYPKGLAGEEIHMHGRIAALCDVFSALTSKRPYREAMTPGKALKVMHSMQNENDHFDPQLFQRFMDHIPPFPIGQEVQLNNNNKGVVCDLPEDDFTKPIVRVLYKGEERVKEPFEIRVNTDQAPEIIEA